LHRFWLASTQRKIFAYLNLHQKQAATKSSGERKEKMKGRKSGFRAGLPDGLLSKPKIPIWVNLGGP
jgi:hypothetical protein